MQNNWLFFTLEHIHSMVLSALRIISMCQSVEYQDLAILHSWLILKAQSTVVCKGLQTNNIIPPAPERCDKAILVHPEIFAYFWVPVENSNENFQKVRYNCLLTHFWIFWLSEKTGLIKTYIVNILKAPVHKTRMFYKFRPLLTNTSSKHKHRLENRLYAQFQISLNVAEEKTI